MKKVGSVILAAVVAAGCAIGVFAQPSASVIQYIVDGHTVYSDSDLPISPRFKYLTSVAATISRSGSTITCSGTIAIHQDYNVGIVVWLQRSKDGKNWSDVPSAVWVDEATEQGVTPVSGTFTAVKGYQYRVSTSASVKNSSGQLLEAVTAVSGVEYYL